MIQQISRWFAVIAALMLVAQAAGAATLPDFAQLVADSSDAVVNISTDQATTRRALPPDFEIPDLPKDSPFQDFLERFLEDMPVPPEARSLGSGFIISKDGYILTSAHVIADAERIVVRFSDRRELEAKVVGTDRRSDVALLKVEADDLPAVRIGDPEQLAVGEWVLAIGSPFGFESSATAGIVSAKGRSLPNENYVPFIQTDVAINPGNSGGPLFNLDGEVVGINAQIFSRTGGFMGLSFSVPINIAMRVADQLKISGRVQRGWLGVAIQDVTQELAESFGMDRPHGALVAEVLPDSPAQQANLVPGDVIVAFNDQVINRMSELPPLVGRTSIGETASLSVVRDRETKKIDIVIGELPGQDIVVGGPAPEPAEKELLGLTLRDLTDDEKKELGLTEVVIVTEVSEGSGRRAGIRIGDLLLQFDGQSIVNVDRFRELVSQADPDRSVPVLIRRGERSLFLALRTE